MIDPKHEANGDIRVTYRTYCHRCRAFTLLTERNDWYEWNRCENESCRFETGEVEIEFYDDD